MKQSRFSRCWNEMRMFDLLGRYETQTQDEIVGEDEATLLGPEQTVMEVPSKLVPAVREACRQTRKCCLSGLTRRFSRRATRYVACGRLSLVVCTGRVRTSRAVCLRTGKVLKKDAGRKRTVTDRRTAVSSRPDRVGAERRPDERSNEALLRGPGFCCRANVRRFQGEVPAGSAEEVSQKLGLSGLRRAGKHRSRKFGGSSHQHRFQGTLEVTFVHQPIDMEVVHLECMSSIFESSSMMCTPIPADP